MFYEWRRYVPMAQRRRQAARELEKLPKQGQRAAPVVIEGRAIARTFWGKAWCDNLERYSDYANRLPRGRSYVRNGSVLDLALGRGKVDARVSGGRLYHVSIEVKPLAKARWKALCNNCGGAIDSVVELLQGRFAKAVMERLCHPKTGLFPAPSEIRFSCTCPDWASMCKHVAASLYGVGARLDHAPELFFALRQVDEQDLIAGASHALALPSASPAPDKILGSDGLAELFGLELGPAKQEPGPRARKPRRKPARRVRNKAKKAAPSPDSGAVKAAATTKRRSRRGKKKVVTRSPRRST